MIAGLVLFLAVDAVLVGVALTASREAPTSTVYIEPTQVPQPTITPTPSAPAVVAIPVRRSLAVAGESTVWRAEGGSCAGAVAPLLQTSTDAGASWTDRDLSRYDVRQILALSVRDANYGTAAVKVGDDCTLVGLRSYTSGRFWEQADEVLSDFTFLDPDDLSAVVVAGARVPAPCAVPVDAATAADTALALCDDGVAFSWDGATWAPLPAQPAALAVVADGAAAEFALVGPDDCPTALGARDDTGELTPRLCAPAPAAPGATASVVAGEATWLWAGDWFGGV